MLRRCLDHQRVGDWSEARMRQEKAAAFRAYGKELLRSGQPKAAADAFDFAERELHKIKVTPGSPTGVRPPEALASAGVGHAGTSLPAQAVPALSPRGGAR